MKQLWFFVPLTVLMTLLWFLNRGLQLNPREVPSPLIGKSAPEFTLSRLDDAAIQMRKSDMQGQVWMLNVWASWCAACREEQPVLLRLASRASVPILGLDYKDERSAGQRWLRNFGNPFVGSLYDEDGRVGMDWGVYGVPETFIIDKQGVIRFKHIGALTEDVIRTQVEPLLRNLNG